MRDRFVAAVTRVVGLPRVAIARRVLDRFAAADGALLAAGVAYNAIFALIPIGLVATGVAGLVLDDARSRADMVRTIADFLPPLAGVVDEIVAGLSRASPSLSIVGLVLAAWGTSRLFASLESAIAQMDVGAPRRSLIHRTARRLGSIAVLAGIVLAAIVVTPTLAIAVEMNGGGPARPLLDVLLAILPPVLGGLAIAAVYKLIPLTRPTWRAIGPPTVVGAVALVVLTRIFVFVAPRVFGANLVYGTLGAILVGLTWLDLVFTIVLLGAAWVRERTTSFEAVVV
ncbi:MAG TPA: YihY/virulence factor BrkB family protein [Candidatus Limnocylindrales bacterium]|nr:YihY/virulence factor BrkB family protein [Candidatus Limnocylindrales bacterium]